MPKRREASTQAGYLRADEASQTHTEWIGTMDVYETMSERLERTERRATVTRKRHREVRKAARRDLMGAGR